MPASGEPEKYSLNEMMERLNQASTDKPETGELVTRADGSQAIRVRKRKRRSSQPHKDQAVRTRRIRIVQVTVALVVLLLLGLAAGGLFVYSNSTPFRKGLADKIADSSGADTELMQFRVTPGGAYANQLNFQWPEGNILQSLRLSHLEADILPLSYLGKSWSGNEAHAKQGILELRLPVAGEPLHSGSSPNTSQVSFDRLSISKLDISLPSSDPSPFKLSGTEASFYPNNSKNVAELRLNSGKLAIAGWPVFQMERAFMEFRGDAVEIPAIRLRTENDTRGLLELAGTVQPYSPGQRAILDLRAESFQFKELAGPLGDLVDGRIDSREAATPGTFSFFPTGEPAPVLELAFANSLTSTVSLSNLPFLSALARAFDDPSIARPSFNTKATAHLRREGNAVRLTQLDFESFRKIALKGEIIAGDDQSLRGSLDVGIAPPLITSASDPRFDRIFGPVSEGFRWITVTLAGTVIDPRDNFAEIEAGTVSATRDHAEPGTENTPPALDSNEMWDELTKPR